MISIFALYLCIIGWVAVPLMNIGNNKKNSIMWVANKNRVLDMLNCNCHLRIREETQVNNCIYKTQAQKRDWCWELKFGRHLYISDNFILGMDKISSILQNEKKKVEGWYWRTQIFYIWIKSYTFPKRK